MTTYPSNFDQEAAIAAILFVADRVEGVNMHKLAKILYFADKMHLENYGRQIFGDDYIAFPFGPVPARTYDMIGLADSSRTGMESLFLVGPTEHFRVESEGKNTIQRIYPRHEPNLDALSESDIECLTEAIWLYRGMEFKPLSDLSHDAAWEAGRQDRKNEMSLEEIIKTLPNAPEILEHLGLTGR